MPFRHLGRRRRLRLPPGPDDQAPHLNTWQVFCLFFDEGVRGAGPVLIVFGSIYLFGLLLESCSVGAQAPVPKALREAKTAYLVNDGTSLSFIDRLADELRIWGRFKLVDSAKQADITMTLSKWRFFGLRLVITAADDPHPLWNVTERAGPTSGAAANLVKQLRERLESPTR